MIVEVHQSILSCISFSVSNISLYKENTQVRPHAICDGDEGRPEE